MSDAIIVLGRGISEDGVLAPDSLSRVRKAVELYRAGAATKIVASGKWSYHLPVPLVRTEAEAMKACAVELGVPADDILLEDESMDTLGNVYFTKKRLAEPNGWRSLTIVASDEHIPRARYLFEKIYGNNYICDFQQSERVLNDEQYSKELEHERNSLATSRKWLDQVKNGDDEVLWQLVQATHPAYMIL